MGNIFLNLCNLCGILVMTIVAIVLLFIAVMLPIKIAKQFKKGEKKK